MIEGHRRQLVSLTLSLLLVTSTVFAQGANGSIKGRATDSAGGVLPGAIVTVTPKGASTVTDNQGEYSITGLAPGDYAVSVNYLGFNVFTKPVTRRSAGESLRVDATLEVATVSEQVLVTAVRPRGEAEQINRQRTADNIVQVLSAEVITSLPNANIADALGRLPSVTLERDEGEGKYVQIRGTEPRLSNTDDRRRERAVARERRAPDQAGHAGVGSRRVDRDQQDAAGQHGRRRHRRKRQHADEDRRRAADDDAVGAGRLHADHRRTRRQPVQHDSRRAVRRDEKHRRVDRRHLRLERARHQRHRAVADGVEPEPALRQHGSARLHVLPDAVGHVRQHRLPT